MRTSNCFVLAVFLAMATACGGNSGNDVDAGICGNGVIDPGEFCDGADLGQNDCTTLGLGAGALACNADCTYDFSGCTLQPVCGNGVLEGAEQCDDGNTTAGDGCDASCNFETPAGCGDGVLDVALGEQCDDGNTDPGDGCDPSCQFEPVGQSCGDGTIQQSLEKCDPPEAMPADGDGCNATCNLSGQVTTLASGLSVQSMTSDNTYLWLGVQDCAADACGVARIDIAACTAAPGTAACDPVFLSGGGPGSCACSTGSCFGGGPPLVPAPPVVDGDANTATFENMGTITTDGTTVWIAHQHLLREVDVATGAVTTVAGTAGSCAAIDGTGTGALFHGIRGLTYWNDHVYLLDGCEDVLRRYDPATDDVTTIAGTREPDPQVTQNAPYTCPDPAACNFNNSCAGPVGGPTAGMGTNIEFVSPRYMTADNAGNLYIIDTNGEAIFKYDTASTQGDILISGYAGDRPASYTDGAAGVTTIGRPRGLVSDGTSIYFQEQLYATVRQLELASVTTSTFVGTMGCFAGAQAPRDGLGADSTQLWYDNQSDRCAAMPPAGTPIFNVLVSGAMTYHFPSRSIYLVDGSELRRIE